MLVGDGTPEGCRFSLRVQLVWLPWVLRRWASVELNSSAAGPLSLPRLPKNEGAGAAEHAQSHCLHPQRSGKVGGWEGVTGSPGA